MPPMLAAALAVAFAAMGMSAVMAAPTTFEGVVDTTSGHNDTVWTVTQSSGVKVILPDVPVSDYDNQPVPVKSRVRVTCTLGNARVYGLLVDCLDLKPVKVLSTQSVGDSSYKVSAFTGQTTAGVTYGITMAVVDMSECGLTQPMTVSQVQQYLTNTGKQIDACSFGRMKVDPKRINVTSVALNCTEAKPAIESCDVDALELLVTLALGNITGEIGKLHVGMVLPEGSSCDWSALAQVGGPFTWFTPTDYGIGSVGTVIQELLHNFGLHHSSKDKGVCTCHGQKNCKCHEEYGDDSTPMGDGNACLTAPEMYRLNWATAIASLDSLSLQPGQPVTYQLPATHTTSTNMVIAKPNWLGADYTENVYFSLRTKSGPDAELVSTYDGVVSVHITNQKVDATTSDDDMGVHLLTTIKAGTTRFLLEDFNLVVRTGPLQKDQMSFTICRYDEDKSECNLSVVSPSPSAAPPPPSPPTSGAGECKDKEDDCSYWGGLGYCASDSEYAPYMSDNCPVTCGACGGACADLATEAKCAQVSDVGCEGDQPIHAFLRANCRKSCKLCGGTTAALTAASTGQQCVDLAGSCDIFKEVTGCKPNTDNAKLWMQLNCQKTCELCPFSRSGAAVADQPPLGCSFGYDVKGAEVLNTTQGLNLTACWDLCYDAVGCYLFTHYANNNTCVLHNTLEDAAKKPDYLVKGSASTSLCVVGTDQTDLKAVPEVQTWFYCVNGLDVPGKQINVLQVKSELACAKACNETAACRLYTLLSDNSTCVLKSDLFSMDAGSKAQAVTKSCVQTFYTSPADSASSRRRRALIDTSSSSVGAAGGVVTGRLDGSRAGVMRRAQALARKALVSA